MNLVDFAEKELERAGLFDSDQFDPEGSDYNGGLGKCALELIKVLASQGHSGNSLEATVELFTKLAGRELLTPIHNPMVTGDWVDRTEMSGYSLYQSTHNSSLFSDDGGLTWWDVDLEPTPWEKFWGVRKVYVEFPPAPWVKLDNSDLIALLQMATKMIEQYNEAKSIVEAEEKKSIVLYDPEQLL